MLTYLAMVLAAASQPAQAAGVDTVLGDATEHIEGEHTRGPTAHFLKKDVNLKLSCAACELAFEQFNTRLSKVTDKVMRAGEVDKDKVSSVVDAAMGRACKVLQKRYALKWDPITGRPAEFGFFEAKGLTGAERGSEGQQMWAKQFLEHRCGWLHDKYFIEVSLQFSSQQLPRKACPIAECNPDAERRLHEQRAAKLKGGARKGASEDE